MASEVTMRDVEEKMGFKAGAGFDVAKTYIVLPCCFSPKSEQGWLTVVVVCINMCF